MSDLDTRMPGPPPASSETVRAVMMGNRKRDTRPERAIRSELHRRGLRFHVDRKVGKGRSAPRPDIVFSARRVAVFVDGCYWHGCAEHGTRPRTNSPYWDAKIARNRARDDRNTAELEADGWTVVRIWEHEPVHAAADRVEALVRSTLAA